MFIGMLDFDVMEYYIGKTFEFFEEYMYMMFDFESKTYSYTFFEEHTTYKYFHGDFGNVHVKGTLYFAKDEKTIIGIRIETAYNKRSYNYNYHCDTYETEHDFFMYGTEHYYDEY